MSVITFNSTKQKISNWLIVLCLLFSVNLSSQIIYSETFSEANKGFTNSLQNPSNGQWTITGNTSSLVGNNGDYFRTSGGELVAQDLDNEVCFETSTINISSYPAVNFSLDLSESGDMESDDYVDVEYRINGGSWTMVPNWDGDGNGSHTLNDDWGSNTVSLNGLSGNTLQIRVCVVNYSSTENHIIDNVVVSAPVQPVTNPDLAANCPLKVVLVLDESGSINNAGATGTVRTAASAFVGSLVNSAFPGFETQLAVIEFNSQARIVNINGSGGGYGTVNAAYQGAFNTYVNNNSTAGYNPAAYANPNFYTNWEDAFFKVTNVTTTSGMAPDLVLFVTDGNPTAHMTGTTAAAPGGQIIDGTNAAAVANALSEAIPAANVVKNAGSHVFVLAVGDGLTDAQSELNIQDISGTDKDLGPGGPPPANDPDIYTADYAIIPFSELQQCLEDIPRQLCGTTLSIDKTINNTELCSDGTEYTFTITVTDEDDDNDVLAKNVVLTDEILSGYSFVSSVPAPSSNVGNTYTWNLGDIPNEGSSVVTVTVTANATGDYSNTASAVADNAIKASDEILANDVNVQSPPVITCPSELTLDCNEDYETAIQNWIDTASATNGGTITTNPTTAALILAQLTEGQSFEVIFTATNDCGTDECTVKVNSPICCVPAATCNLTNIDEEGCDIPVAFTDPADVFKDIEACGATVTMTHEDVGDTNVCGDGDEANFTRTYTLLYDGVTFATCPQTIVITAAKPVISTTATDNQDFGCNPTIVPPTFTVADTCNPSATPTVTPGSIIEDGCNRSQIWTATYTDSCIDADQVSIKYTWTVDTEAPVETSNIADKDLGCNPTSITFDTPTFDGGCSAVTDVAGFPKTGDIIEDGCDRSQTKTWKVTDCSGLETEVSQTLKWTVDTEAPVLTSNNNFQVCGTSNASASAYDDGWQSGDNDGSGFEPWFLFGGNYIVSTSTSNGNGDSNSDGDIDSVGNVALGLADTSARREFEESLSIGSTVSFDFDNGTIKPSVNHRVAFYLLDENYNLAWAFDYASYSGDLLNYRYWNGSSPVDTGIPFTDEGIRIKITLITQNQINPIITDIATGTIYNLGILTIDLPANKLINKISFSNSNSGSNIENYLFINNLEICHPNVKDLGCNPSAITFDTPTFDGGCSDAVAVAGFPKTGDVIEDGCDRSQTKTWKVTDCSGLETEVSQTLKWTVDTEAPKETTTIADKDLGCNPTAIAFDTPTFDGGCSDAVAVAGFPKTGDVIEDGCDRSQTKTWKVTDCSGLETTVTQKLTWTVDTEAPVETTNVTDKELGCNPSVIAFDTPTFDGGCSDAVAVTGFPKTGDVLEDGCDRSQTKTWKVTDCSGLETTVTQKLTWTVDTEAPVEDTGPVSAGIAAGAAPETSFGKADSPAPVTAATGPGAHVVMRDKVDKERRRRRLTSVGLIWAVPLALLFVAAVLGYVFRQNIVNGIPQTATLYKAVGIDVTLSGLSIEDPITRSALVDGKPVLVVNGAVRNITAKAQDVPLVELSLHSKDGEALVTWLVDTQKTNLGKKERVTFVSEYPNPPVDAVKLRYRFANETAVAAQGGDVENVMGVQ